MPAGKGYPSDGVDKNSAGTAYDRMGYKSKKMKVKKGKKYPPKSKSRSGMGY